MSEGSPTRPLAPRLVAENGSALSSHRRPPARQLVVIGGSLTGLFAAAALAGDGREVLILERDEFPEDVEARSGVPQGRQAHVLLHRGLRAAEELLPGLRSDLLAAGAVATNSGRLLWLSALGWMPESDDGFELVSATRPLIEHVVRTRTLALPGVRTRTGRRVGSLRRSGRRWALGLDDGSLVAADFVFDASGRNSRLPVWLRELGVGVEEPERLDVKVGYATRRYRPRGQLLTGCAGLVVVATPERPRGALALPVEDDQWLVSVVGFGEARPERDDVGFERALRELADPGLADLVAVSDAVADVHVHRQTANVWHHYEKVRPWPPGIVAVGDALCAFDPVYGQGITVGALQALVLRRAVRRGLAPADSGRLQRKLAAEVVTPWSIATGADSAFRTDGVALSGARAVLGRWTQELARLAIHGNRRSDRLVSRVYNLESPPAVLLHPALFYGALHARLFGYGAATTRSPLLDELAALSVPDRPGRPAMAARTSPERLS